MIARIVEPELARTYHLATPAGKAPDAATQVVRQALADEARSMIASGRWDAQFLGDGKP
ncbi:hypothetical protein D3C72_2454920 [compost metagenome]